MHSSLVRLQNVFGFFTSVAVALGAAIALSVIISPQSPKAKLALQNVQVVKGRPHYYSTKREEYAHIRFNLDADLTSLFSWNTKQVFVYVTVTFPSTPTSKSSSIDSSTPYSEATLWDAIIPARSLPWHPNTYIHPDTSSNSNSNNKKSSSSSKKSSSKSKAAKSKPYPKGTSEGILKLRNQKPKYQITTPSSKIASSRNCTLHLHYNIQPWVGMLVWDTASASVALPFWDELEGKDSVSFDMPALKSVGGGAGGGGSGASKIKEDLGTETGAEANRGSPA